ncbi:hypothetical protein CCH79_00015504 [Gambusia affinis]|uniref:Matrin-type domain-containing protein n=1 Tax=Gambusia affinis TaxID=33528 RepID=A0A315WB13_GAMAF|nr:hypothetical protein CCH79_00015504 [Gambusia affinis]
MTIIIQKNLQALLNVNSMTSQERGNFVTVDEVGEIEEEEEKEAVTRRGRPRKSSRLTPVRKSTRGKTAKEEKHRQEEEENKSLLSASLDSSWTLETFGPSGDFQSETQRIEEGKNTEAASIEHQPLPNDGLKLGFEEAERQEHRRACVKDKRQQEPTGPEAKRPRSQPQSVSVNLQLPPFTPKNPLGKEFVNPTSGFFCSLCSVFYLNEDTAKEIHCSSQEHYDNLKNCSLCCAPGHRRSPPCWRASRELATAQRAGSIFPVGSTRSMNNVLPVRGCPVT